MSFPDHNSHNDNNKQSVSLSNESNNQLNTTTDSLMDHDDQQDEDSSLTDDQILEHLRDLSDLPASLIITNITIKLFEDDSVKECFEKMFKVFDENEQFQYFKSFRRCKINFSSPNAATFAKLSLHKSTFHGCPINCFFAQSSDPITEAESGQIDGDPYHLRLPKLQKQFLISPPASPPTGWEQCHEKEPLAPGPTPFEILSHLAALAVDSNDEKMVVVYDNERIDEEKKSTAAEQQNVSTSGDYSPTRHNPKIIVYGCANIDQTTESDDGDEDDDAYVRYKMPRTPRPPGVT